MTIFYVCIGNSDDKLPQAQWALFCHDLSSMVRAVEDEGGRTFGIWYSSTRSPWQSMCACLEVPSDAEERMRNTLASLAYRYRQDSITLARVSADNLEFIEPVEP